MSSWTERSGSWFARRPSAMLVVLYAGIAALAALAHLLPQGPLHRAVHALTGGTGLGAFDAAVFGRQVAVPPPTTEMWAIGTVAMISAGLLALPVAWLYTITRQKRGYRQSVVQTLVLLPVVVAGVVVLVKFSLALAFSLAGIVAAVRFRNTLEDSKDAVYIFVSTGIGLAAGVELSVAATLSVIFNVTTLLLFRWDFGRNPARLEGEMAEERLRRALSIANRTSQFVARVDREILGQMAPEQLEALADRAWRRRKEATDETGDEEQARLDCTLTVRTDGSAAAKAAVEGVLERVAKDWRFQRAHSGAEEGQLLEYALRLRKSAQPTGLLDALREQADSGVRHAELR